MLLSVPLSTITEMVQRIVNCATNSVSTDALDPQTELKLEAVTVVKLWPFMPMIRRWAPAIPAMYGARCLYTMVLVHV